MIFCFSRLKMNIQTNDIHVIRWK